MPNLLYIDTAAAVATVALSAGGHIRAMRKHENAHEQAALLNTMVHEVLAEASLDMDGIDAICVCAGPGSYTGLRVGLSTAKGIAYVKDIPLMLFNRLDLLAWGQDRQSPFALALKARAGEYFLATYTASGLQDVAPQHIFAQDLLPFAAQGIDFITDDPDFNSATDIQVIDPHNGINIDRWITRAEERFQQKHFDDLAYSEPFYLKGAYTTQSKK